MNFPRTLTTVFPPSRKSVTLRALSPLIVFLALFIGGCLYLELRHIVMFSFPAMFVLLAVTPWVWWMHHAGFSGLSGGRALLALMTRLILVGAFILLLAEPRAVRKNHKLAVVYALDVSDSIGEKATDAALTYVQKTVHDKPQKDEVGLVVFGRDAAVELPPRENFPFEAINSRVSKDGTNLEKSLSLAAAVLPEEAQGRIVLISDGTATEGNLAGTLDDLKSRGVAVDVLPIQYDYGNEVWLERLELPPRQVKIGDTFEVAVILSALKKGTGKLVLRENGRVILQQDVQFEAGKNRYVLPIYLREPGYYEYAATIEVPPGQDGWQENNTAINYLFLRGEGKALVVTDPTGEERDWQFLVRALKESKRIVELRAAHEFPRDALSLLPYDCVIFVNVPADAFDVVQLQALHDAVYNQGVGFLMVGGKNSYGPGGYHRSAVEEVLPVTMDVSQKKVLPKGALVIILHSCEFPEGNAWGRRIVKEAIRVLGKQDEAGLLVSDWQQNGDRWVFPLTPASQFDKMIALINQCNPGDMPSFQTIMQMGLTGLKASDAAAKHMIILSDGDPSPPTPALINDFVTSKVSVSTVSIFPHGGFEIQTLKAIAFATGGRYYDTNDPDQLPAIFIKEAKTLKRSMIQNKTFVPTIEMTSSILKGIESLPELHGYVLTSIKERATTILKGPETEQIDPVLATWRYGLGKTAAFTSDLSSNWAAAWVGWSQYQGFVKQLVTDISRVEKESDLLVRSFTEGSNAMISVEDQHPQESFLEVQALVSGPHDRTETVAFKQIGPRRYQAQLPLWGKGRYQIMVAGAGAGRNERATGGLVVPYSPEYLRFRSNPMVLNQIAEKTGGRVLTGNEKSEDIFPKQRNPKESSRPIFDWFLLALAILLPLDVGLRRVQLDWVVIRGWLRPGRKEAAAEGTLGALLQVKQKVESTLAARKEERPLAPPGDFRAAPSRSVLPSREKISEPQKVEPQEPGDTSTTERLLALKKKWKKDQPEEPK